MDENRTQAAANRLAAKLEVLDLDDDERAVLVALLGAGAARVEPADEVAGFALDAYTWFTPVGHRMGAEAPRPIETITCEVGGIYYYFDHHA
jgi:hypothetical protein